MTGDPDPITGGTVSPMRDIDPALAKQMARELARLARELARTESKIDRERRDQALYDWHKRLGPGSLSEIARQVGLSRVQAGRIVRAYRDAEETGLPRRPSRHYYQSETRRESVAP